MARKTPTAATIGPKMRELAQVVAAAGRLVASIELDVPDGRVVVTIAGGLGAVPCNQREEAMQP
jgi:hypothetical protein